MIDPSRTSPNEGTAAEPAKASVDDLLQRAFRFALSLTHDQARAEDLVQDAWVSILEARAPRTRRYVFSVIRNRFIDQYRRAARVVMEPFDARADVEAAVENHFWDEPCVSPSTSAALERALGRLRPEERETLYLSAVEGFTAQEISTLRGCPRGTVLSMMHRARHKLRRWITSEGPEETS